MIRSEMSTDTFQKFICHLLQILLFKVKRFDIAGNPGHSLIEDTGGLETKAFTRSSTAVKIAT